MIKRIVLPLIFILCIISACSQSKNEEVELYEKEFLDKSENWEVKLHLKELSETWSSYKHNQEDYEETTLKIRYLKDIDEELEFYYEVHYGNPPKLSRTTAPFDNPILTPDNIEFTETLNDQRMIEEVCFGTLTLKIRWRDDEGKWQEETHIFNDSQNPQCENIVIMYPRGLN